MWVEKLSTWNKSQTLKWKKSSEHRKNCWLSLFCKVFFNIYTTAITIFTLHRQSTCVLPLYSIVTNQRRAIPQPRPHALILMRLPVPREKSTGTQRDGARSNIQPWIDEAPQKHSKLFRYKNRHSLLPPDTFWFTMVYLLKMKVQY